MDNQLVKDRVNLLSTLFADGQSQIVTQLLKTDKYLGKNAPPNMIRNSLRLAACYMRQQMVRAEFMANELENLMEDID